MLSSTSSFPEDPALLRRLLLSEIKLREQRDTRIQELEELVRFYKSREFSRSKESFIHPGQGTLFNEVEDIAASTSLDDESKQTITYTRGKPKRRPLPDGLPRQDVVHVLPQSELQCSCGSCLSEIGEEVSEQLDIIPARFLVLRHIRKKYACKSCQEGVRTAPLPPQPIPKSFASPGLLAYIATCKYVDGLPLHRIEKTFSRINCDVPRSTQASWMIKLSELFTPLLNVMSDELLDGQVLHMDETTIQVLKEKGRSPTSKSFMWVLARGDPDKRIIMFNYDPSRSAQVATFLAGEFSGYLVTDGYEGYRLLAARDTIIHCGCWDHARRKFHDVVKGRKKGSKPSLADEALYWISRLYDVERLSKNAPERQRYILRDLYSRGIIRYLKKWKDEHLFQVTPKSLLGKALRYLDRQWPKLVRFLEDGAVPFSNAIAENAIRPFAVGRKAWLFSDTTAGAHASAAIYSVVETAKANGIEPYEYLRQIIEQLPSARTVLSFREI